MMRPALHRNVTARLLAATLLSGAWAVALAQATDTPGLIELGRLAEARAAAKVCPPTTASAKDANQRFEQRFQAALTQARQELLKGRAGSQPREVDAYLQRSIASVEAGALQAKRQAGCQSPMLQALLKQHAQLASR